MASATAYSTSITALAALSAIAIAIGTTITFCNQDRDELFDHHKTNKGKYFHDQLCVNKWKLIMW